MGLFSSKPKISICAVCGKSDVDGCGLPENHVVEIRGDQPAWLPERLRAQAQGQYTWFCVRCGSYPTIKWPHTGGAWAGLSIHLGQAHGVGEFRSMGSSMPRIEMASVR